MKIILLTTLSLLIFGLGTYCQTFSEWWRQKKTRIKYLHKQVAALETLKATLEEGYDGAEDGIDSEEVNMMLEYKLTETYLRSLGNVKPIFLKNDGIRSSYGFAKAYIKIVEEELDDYSKNPWLKVSEVNTLKSRLGLIKSDMEQAISDLGLLITDDKVHMDDGARWQMLEGIEEHIELAGRYLMMEIAETAELIQSREHEVATDKDLKIKMQ